MMPLVQVIWLGASAAFFALWVWMLFRILWQAACDARETAEARDGKWPSAIQPITQFSAFLRTPARQCSRWQLIALTAALLTLYLLGLAIWPTGPG
ncbi:hypothetical protein [Roseovarius sp. Pro17]|uniref:hypothetical protein n=1 Tax=Roseovarius sp. Pro17 TaxID=3108175 RepID=UPI002D7774C2|nr:hypothetical protein [Roseovarius sp. Pro17]